MLKSKRIFTLQPIITCTFERVSVKRESGTGAWGAVGVCLFLKIGLVSTLPLTPTLEQHSVKKKINHDPGPNPAFY